MGEQILVKAVIVTMWERGTPEDGEIGELELWVQREKLFKKYPFPIGDTDILMNYENVLAVLTGIGASNASTVIAALGSDSRFDLSKAYWIISGVAGVDPEDASIGSASWAEYIVDGDLMHELDSKEAPDDWPYGKLSLSGSQPNERTPHVTDKHIVHRLNPSLVEWAYKNTKNIQLTDYPELKTFRAQFTGYPNAVKSPFVLKGDSLGSCSYWHGDVLTKWANDWVKMYTEGKGNFVMSNMEDHGTITALHRLSKAGLVDYDKILVLRTASNYCKPPPGEDALWHFSAPFILGGLPAFEAAYQVGKVILDKILSNWDEYKDSIPALDR
jgi:purine nucleoside permease